MNVRGTKNAIVTVITPLTYPGERILSPSLEMNIRQRGCEKLEQLPEIQGWERHQCC